MIQLGYTPFLIYLAKSSKACMCFPMKLGLSENVKLRSPFLFQYFEECESFWFNSALHLEQEIENSVSLFW